MNQNLRYSLIGTGIIGLLLAAGFILQIPAVTALWPWQITRLSAIFLASILAAASCPVIWLGLSGETAGIPGGSINFALMYTGMAIFCYQLYFADTSRTPILLFAIVATVFGAMSWYLSYTTWNTPFVDTRPTPRLVRYSFAFFALVLLLVGSALVLKVPDIFPWQLTVELSVMYGWIFLGAMTYFVYALYNPMWANAKGQLLGFLAYDIVLIIPFLQHFATVPPNLLDSLIVYVAVIIYSTVLAIYFLLVHKETRLLGTA